MENTKLSMFIAPAPFGFWRGSEPIAMREGRPEKVQNYCHALAVAPGRDNKNVTFSNGFVWGGCSCHAPQGSWLELALLHRICFAVVPFRFAPLGVPRPMRRAIRTTPGLAPRCRGKTRWKFVRFRAGRAPRHERATRIPATPAIKPAASAEPRRTA